MSITEGLSLLLSEIRISFVRNGPSLTQWTAWKEKFKAQVVDVGDGLKHGAKLLKDGKVTDGPLPEAKEIIGGYSVIQTETIEQAIEVARACPIVYMPNSVIEIREMMGF